MIGQQLKHYRKTLDFSASQLAKEANMTSTLLSFYETEKRIPSFHNLIGLLYQLATVSTITTVNYDAFINESNYDNWRQLVAIDDDPEFDFIDIYAGDDYPLMSFQREQAPSSEELEEKLRFYFFNFSYRENSDYSDYMRTGKLPLTTMSHRFTRSIPILRHLSLSDDLTKWWLDYYKNDLLKPLKASPEQLNQKEREVLEQLDQLSSEAIFQRYNRLATSDFDQHSSRAKGKHQEKDIFIEDLLYNFHGSTNQSIIFDLEDINHRKLTLQLDRQRLNQAELRIIRTVIEGIRAERKKQEEKIVHRGRRPRREEG